MAGTLWGASGTKRAPLGWAKSFCMSTTMRAVSLAGSSTVSTLGISGTWTMPSWYPGRLDPGEEGGLHSFA